MEQTLTLSFKKEFKIIFFYKNGRKRRRKLGGNEMGLYIFTASKKIMYEMFLAQNLWQLSQLYLLAR